LYTRYTPEHIQEAIDSAGVYAVVEIPAGTSFLQAMDTAGVMHKVSSEPVDFLPFPGNYGFVAGCGRQDSIDGKLHPLPILVLMHSLEAESIVQVNPIAVLLLNRAGQVHPVVMAVPADSTLQSIRVHSFVDFITEYETARHILQQWFLNYHGRDMFGFTGWRDEHYARQLIADWKLPE
jgi:inorganic pyrophosphatase